MENEDLNVPAEPVPEVTAPPKIHAYPRVPDHQKNANTDPLRFVMPLNPSIWAIIAGYLGLGSVLLVFAPFALVAGILGLREIKANPTKTGKGRAWFGLIMGAICSGIIVLIVILSIFPRK